MAPSTRVNGSALTISTTVAVCPNRADPVMPVCHIAFSGSLPVRTM
jgi:hypothetical protein